jgi:kinesin family protein 18/19
MKNQSLFNINNQSPNKNLPNQQSSNLKQKFSKQNMIVAVRCRPLSQRELDFSNINTITIEKEIVTVSNPIEYNSDSISNLYLNKEKNITITKTKQNKFAFDFAFQEKTNQEEIYHYTTETLLQSVFDGFNSTVFAYGATGSGKTYTMVGNGENPGLMVRTISDLFNMIKSNNNDNNYRITINYIEVYNETLKDLLSENENSNVELRSDPLKGNVLIGCEFIEVNNANDAFKLLIKGNRRRRETPTVNNSNSSRSHAILQINLEREEKNNNYYSFGKFILVDLAGSEKISANSGKISKANESGSINKSLLALANCINILCSSNSKNFIPWRDSKLTRILQESLSGNCRIVMIATISPSLMCIEETMYTLQYANRAKNLKVNLKKNVVDNKKITINKYEEIIQNLQQQINETKKEIANKQKLNVNNSLNISNDLNNTNNNIVNNSNNSIIINDDFQSEMINHFQSEINVKKEIIEKEREIENLKNEKSDNEYKLNHKTENVNQQTLVNLIETNKKEIETKTNNMNNLYIHQSNLINKRKEIQKKLISINSNKLNNIYKYYMNLLENLSSEHRKYLNISELHRKEQKIQILTEQLDLRDKYIMNAGQEIAKNNGKFVYKNPKYESAEMIEVNPYKPVIIKVSPMMSSMRNFSVIENNNNNNNNLGNKRALRQNNSSSNILKNTNPIARIQSPTISKTRQYNQELIPLLKNQNKKQNNNNYLHKLRNFRNSNQSSVFIENGRKLTNNASFKFNQVTQAYNRSGYAAYPVNYGIIQENIRGMSPSQFSRKNNNENYLTNVYNNNNSRNNSFFENNKLNDSFGYKTHTTRLETEVQKKVKTILAKDIIGRYKRSPYIKNNIN